MPEPGARTASRIRVFIVDDSAVMRSLLRSVVSTDPALEVAGTASDGLSALNALPVVRPDLVLLDVEMPVMDGLATLKQMRERAPRLPIIMCSALTQRCAHVTIESLASGASDYVAKPAGQASRETAMKALAAELIPKIRALTTHRPVPFVPFAARAFSMFPASAVQELAEQGIPTTPAAVLIGASTGGPAALDVILSALPASFPLPILVAQHMPDLFTRQLAERLNTRCALRVREAEEGMAVHAGNVYIAHGNWHIRVMPASAPGQPHTLHLDQAPPENHCRPSVDVLFRSAAQVYGGSLLAVMLTGMGHDGLAGTRILHKLGATILAQDEATSAVWGMPGALVHENLAHAVLPLRQIEPEIQRLISRHHHEAMLLRESVA
jgi:two-component system, chemotaxis family, protein-glutamate methylesterase/glutaminase